jgi:hypothetical protein
MPLKVRVIITGICAILRDYKRLLLPNALRTSKSSDGTVLPPHHAYIMYRLSENQLPTPYDHSDDHGLAAIFLNGDEIVIKGEPYTPPEDPGKIPTVASMEDISPGIQLSSAALQPPDKLSHALISAYFPLDKGKFSAPNPPDRRRWHFFPQRGKPIQGPLAQKVTYRIDLDASQLKIALRAFGSGGSAQDILWLKPKEGDEVTILLGNTPFDDIFPKDETAQPPLGPDAHFEIYYRLASNPGSYPLPIPHYEGEKGASAHGGGHGGGHAKVDAVPELRDVIRFAAIGRDEGPGTFDALGGANCPPSQWP